MLAATNPPTSTFLENALIDSTDMTKESLPTTLNPTSPPAVPGAPTLLSIQETQGIIGWPDVSGESGYQVRWTSDGGLTYTLETLPPDISPSPNQFFQPYYAISGFSPSTTWLYQVRACNDGGGCSDWSPPLAVTGQSLPAAPDFLRIDAAYSGDTATTVVWRGQFSVTGYQVAWQTYGSSTTTVVDVPSFPSEWQHAGQTPGTTYYYWVRSCGMNGCSPWTGPLTVTTTGGTAPAMPANFQLTGVTAGSTSLSWSDVGTETRFELVWNRYGTLNYVAVSLPANTTTWTHMGLDAGWTYYYWVRACIGGALCSPFTDAVVAITAGGTPPAAPTNLRTGEVTSNRIELLWDDASTNELSFQIAWTPTAVADYHFAEVPANSTRWLHLGLPASTSYYYWVQSCIGALCSGWYAFVQGTTTGSGDAPLRGPVVPSSGLVLGPNVVPAIPPPSQAQARAAQAPLPPTAANLPKPAPPSNVPLPTASPTPTPRSTASVTATSVAGTSATATSTAAAGSPPSGGNRLPTPGSETLTSIPTLLPGRGTPLPTEPPTAVPTSSRGGG